ncbi:LCP family glycopolymer transferase [Enterococcus dongliensis]|uniref:LCP family glycopolymer transferase n=1 Tax=Enterococcus dongliensis TaxID=2559925 RepID=UPI00288FFA83|nr:LCP family protein [Enterococcus dongliensis]MDT2673743.1 LCP family protein [Enterococcus dongliensis]
MSKAKKIILIVVGILVLFVGAASIYLLKVNNDVDQAISKMTRKVNYKKKRTASVDLASGEPFSILLMGTDTGDKGRTYQGRSDSMMLVTINPKKKQTLLTSLGRDIYTQIVGYHGDENTYVAKGDTYYDKLNAAYSLGGTKMAIETVQTMMDVPIDHYVEINMKGLKTLVDAVGGIEVDNKIDFTLDGVHVKKGKQTLDGKHALEYVRMRHEDPKGDVGRQARQREILSKIIHKMLSVNSVTKYKRYLHAVEDYVRTDLSWNEMVTIVKNYTPAAETIKQTQVEGQGEMIDTIYFQILGLNSLLDEQNRLKKQLELPTKKKLPNLAEEDDNQLFFDDSEVEKISAGTHYDYTGYGTIIYPIDEENY